MHAVVVVEIRNDRWNGLRIHRLSVTKARLLQASQNPLRPSFIQPAPHKLQTETRHFIVASSTSTYLSTATFRLSPQLRRDEGATLNRKTHNDSFGRRCGFSYTWSLQCHSLHHVPNRVSLFSLTIISDQHVTKDRP